MKRIVMIAGGTGGHIIPALAVAKALAEQQVDIHWLGSNSGLEKKLVSPHYPISTIAAGRIRGKGLLTKLLAPCRLAWATLQAWRTLRKLKPNLVVAMGGFVTAPGGLAAKLLGIPLLIHEQNAISGYSNRLLAKFADRTLAAYPNAFSEKVKASVVGNPVKAKIAQLPPPQERGLAQHDKLRLLILGGSQGALAINQLIPQALQHFPHQETIEIWHQCGATHLENVQHAYQAIHFPARVNAFIDEMDQAYSWADYVICRAGALTIAELTASGIGSLLIPFPYAVDDHQWHNGQYLVDNKAAIMTRQNQLSSEALQKQIKHWLVNKEECLQMANNARALAKPQATAQVATACLALMTK